MGRKASPNPVSCCVGANDRRYILANLAKAGIDEPTVFLVCIEREFESWLLFDAQMLSDVLSTEAHRVKVRPPKNPDRHQNPKAAMMKLFLKHRGKRDVDVQFAQRFARSLTALSRLRHCQTFKRFEDCMTRVL